MSHGLWFDKNVYPTGWVLPEALQTIGAWLDQIQLEPKQSGSAVVRSLLVGEMS